MTKRTKQRIGYGAALAAVAVVAIALLMPRGAEATGPEITVYKTPSCECCRAWGEHLEDNGFRVNFEETMALSRIKEEQGVPAELAACHTAVVNGYVVEGHVPAAVILRFLAEDNSTAGLAVPGMPIGSPGMEIPGRAPQSYEVFAFDRLGDHQVYERMRGRETGDYAA